MNGGGKVIEGSHGYATVDVVKEEKKPTLFNKTVNASLMTMGIIFGLIAVITIITLTIIFGIIGMIIAFIITLPALFIAFSGLAEASGTYKVPCPNCGKESPITYRSPFKVTEDFKCSRCKIPVIINWK